MSDKDLEKREEAEYYDPWTYYDEGQHACIAESKNPYEKDTYAWLEWERGYIEMAKKESRDEQS